MKYEDARTLIKTGDLLAWSAGGWSNWHDIQVSLVRMFTKSEYSHVGMAWADHERVFIFEAVGAGVRLFPLSREVPFYWIKRPQEIGGDALDWAFSKLGNRYEAKWKMVIDFIRSFRLDENDEWQCSEFVLGILKQDGEVLTNVATPTGVVKAALQRWGSLTYVEM